MSKSKNRFSFFKSKVEVPKRKRLDTFIQQEYQHLSRNQIQNMISRGTIIVDGVSASKPGMKISDHAVIELLDVEPKYVSRAGFKLEAALDYFNVNVTGFVVLDAGLSTGGFTDCLLQRGVKHVYGVDVGTNQAHDTIKNDQRVIVLEQTNLRELESLPEFVDLVTLDLSFISVLKVIPAVKKLLKPGGQIIALIKPQFEAERSEIGRGGVVKDDKAHQRIIEHIKSEMLGFGFETVGVIESPLLGATSGNKEFLALFKPYV